MEDAQNIVNLPDSIFYESLSSFEEVLEFYKTEMEALGWTLEEENILGSLGELVFSKDGRTVTVLPAQNGDIVAISIEEEK